MRDVAAKASVSIMTVSRVINKEASVSTDTRERVETAIRALNFSPNTAAQQLAAASRVKLALLYDNPSASFMSEFLLGALDESGQSGLQLVVLKHEEQESISALADSLLHAGVDGAVLPPPLCDCDATVKKLQEAGIVLAAVAPGRASTRMSTVRIDNEHAAREIADHLLALGHRRFGFIGGHPNQTVSEQRRWGFIDQLSAAGVAPSDIFIEQGYFTYRSGMEAAERLLGQRPRPTAIFAANDDMAAAVLAHAHRIGIDVPTQLSVVGFDDTAIASAVWPSLTTIRQPVAAMAGAAIAMLAEDLRRRRDAKAEPVQAVHQHLLVVRESTGPAPADAAG